MKVKQKETEGICSKGKKKKRKRTKQKEISNLPDEEFKVIAIYMLTRLERRVDKLSENLNKEIKKIF